MIDNLDTSIVVTLAAELAAISSAAVELWAELAAISSAAVELWAAMD